VVDLDRLEAFARDALRAYPVDPQADLTLVNISENTTYRVEDPATGERTVMRVHRTEYHSLQAIESELAWIAALREAGVVRTARVVNARDGAAVVEARLPDGETRRVVMFEWLPGAEPQDETLVVDFRELGTIAAKLHRHARGWQPPASFSRFSWDYEHSIGSQGHWGRWQDGIGVHTAEREQLGRLDATLRERLTAFGCGADRFGLIHADMRLANLLVDEGNVSVIDFDDCGWGWFMYDLGSALSFIEDHPEVPEMIDAWTRGYRAVAPLSPAEEAELETFVLLRRLLLVAWIGSHADTELAQDLGVEYTRVSCDLAERYLSRFS
jgi:Ser/Thr protein kinase RdoA (MazF antagonist)